MDSSLEGQIDSLGKLGKGMVAESPTSEKNLWKQGAEKRKEKSGGGGELKTNGWLGRRQTKGVVNFPGGRGVHTTPIP